MRLARLHALAFVAAGVLLAAAPVRAQDPATAPRTYSGEQTLIEHVVGALVDIVRDVTLESDGAVVGDRLRSMMTQLQSTPSGAILVRPAAFGEAPQADATDVRAALTAADLEELARLLRDVRAEVSALRAALADEQSYTLADRLGPIERTLGDAVARAERLADEAAEARTDVMTDYRDADDRARRQQEAQRTAERDRRESIREEIRADIRRARDEAREDLREAREDVREARDDVREAINDPWDDDDRDHDDDRWDDDDDDRWRKDWRGPDHDHMGAMIGDFPNHWPYRETGVYRAIPAIRYNRVEGFVLGVGSDPLSWDAYDRASVFGQVGYAFALGDWRYEVGAETFVAGGDGRAPSLKVGGLYRHNTATNDLWKSNWVENSLAAFLFENDFFDYYDVEGWNVYAAGRLTPQAQVSAGFRAEDYRSLERNTGWSLFDGPGFRFNPLVDEGFMQSFVFAAEAGRVRDLADLPRGAAFRAEAEVGQGVGGDFSFNRFVADGRLYIPTSRYSTLALRLRGGTATGDVPVQKAFTLGGVGSVRAYPQNAFYGTRMVLANVEYIVGHASVFDEMLENLHLFGFGDLGWTNRLGEDTFAVGDALAAVGVGVGFDDRAARLELAWPVGDGAFVDSRRPTLWFRLSPTF